MDPSQWLSTSAPGLSSIKTHTSVLSALQSWDDTCRGRSQVCVGMRSGECRASGCNPGSHPPSTAEAVNSWVCVRLGGQIMPRYILESRLVLIDSIHFSCRRLINLWPHGKTLEVMYRWTAWWWIYESLKPGELCYVFISCIPVEWRQILLSLMSSLWICTCPHGSYTHTHTHVNACVQTCGG